MSRAFKLPDLGEGIHEGEVLKIFVSEGDEISEGDPLLEVETDKAAVEIPSPFTGTVEKVNAQEGDIVKVGDVLFVFSDGVKAAEKVPPEKPAPETAEKRKEAAPSEKAIELPAKRDTGPIPASPATRKLARELKVDLADVPPGGPAGLVTAEDVKKFAEGKKTEKKAPPPEREKPERKPAEEKPERAPAETVSARIPSPALPDFSKWGEVKKVPLRSLRRATARQMALSWSQVPHVSNQDLADVTLLEAFRKKQANRIAEKGGRLTLTVFALKAAVAALKAFPYFNASIDMESGEIILKNYYHIGVAVNSDEGLMVPVVRDVDRKSITELSLELADLAQRSRQRKVSLEELQGGTFTITNAGPMGGGYFSPIVNYPEAAILGLGQARMQPAVRQTPEGKYELAARLMMPVVVCFDHRISDGVDAIRFTRKIVDALEDPDELFLNMV